MTQKSRTAAQNIATDDMFHSALDVKVSRYIPHSTAYHFQGARFDLEHPHNAMAKAARHESLHCRVPDSNGACIQPQGKAVKDDDLRVQAVGRPEDTGWVNKKRVLGVETAALKRIPNFPQSLEPRRRRSLFHDSTRGPRRAMDGNDVRFWNCSIVIRALRTCQERASIPSPPDSSFYQVLQMTLVTRHTTPDFSNLPGPAEARLTGMRRD
ncbi:hypothetical protein BDW72DRAFT_190303 [Aspergillus terricola var. indicus]